MARWRFVLLFLLTMALTLPPLQLQVAHAQGGISWIRAVNTSPDTPSLNVFIDDALAASGIGPNTAPQYLKVVAGKHEVTFRLGKDTVANGRVSFELAAGEYATVVAFNKKADLTATEFKDDVSAVARGSVRVRVIHAVTGGPNVDVINPADNSVLFKDVAYGAASDYVTLPVGQYDLQVTAAGDPQTVVVSLKKSQINLQPREKRFDIVLTGESGGRIRALVLTGDTLLASGANQIRFGNFVQVAGKSGGAAPMDVVLNGSSAFQGVAFGTVSFGLAVPPGDYTVDVYNGGKVGKDKPLVSKKVTLGADQSMLVSAVNTLDTIDLQSTTGNFKALRVGTARIQFVHAGAGMASASLQLTDGTALVASTDFGQQGSTLVGGGVYTLKAVDPSGKVLASKDGVKLDPNTGNTVVLFDDDPSKGVGNLLAYSYKVPSVVPVRFVHSSEKAKTVDVYINGKKVDALSNWGFGKATDYIDFDPGNYDVKVYATGADPTSKDTRPLISTVLKLGPSALTVVAIDLAAGPILSPVLNNLGALGPGQARVQVISGSLTVGTIAWLNAADATPLGKAIGIGTGSSAVNVAAGSYTFSIQGLSDTSVGFKIGPEQLDVGSYTVYVVTGPTDADVITLKYQITNAKE